ncbi:amidinotransferase [Candidatus Saccharibacteria bacterium]|nr:amidinotransferase [Candidatus Saccharibacteria bacterium]
MLNQKVLMSGADYFSSADWINPYYTDAEIAVDKAKAEHATIRKAFETAGIEVIQVPPPSTSQDGVYTANWGLVRGEKCVLSRLPGPRKGEEAHAAEILAELGKTLVHVPDGLKFSGQGDSLPCGKYLLAGSGYRSDAAAQAFAAETLGLELVQLHTLPDLDGDDRPVINAATGWPDSFFYDVDLALTVIRDDLIAYYPGAFDEESQVKIANLPIEKIAVSYDEAVRGLSLNSVSTGQTVIMSAHAPQLKAELERRGLKVIPIDAPELAKGGGYIRCVSLTLD